MSDFQKNEILHNIINDLKKDYPSYSIILKKYPGQRFIDSGNLDFITNLYDNVKVINDYELRVLRNISDLNVLYFYTSTLGTMSTFKQKLLLYEIENANILINVNKENIKKTNKLKKFYLIKSDIFVKWNDIFLENF